MSSEAAARGQHITGLAGGEVNALPSGNLFARVVGFSQPPGAVLPSHKHQPGFVYVTDGVQRLHAPPATPRIIRAGEAAFQPSAFHTHANPSTTRPNRWYFIAVWPTGERRARLVSSAAKVVYESQDVEASTLPEGPKIETLRLVTLEPNGRTAAHRYSGLEVLFVLQGKVRVDLAGGEPPATLSAGQGAYVSPGRAEQELNAGARGARYLAFFMTPVGAPFEIVLRQPV